MEEAENKPEQAYPEMDQLGNARSIGRNVIGGLAITAAVATFIFEQSPANEALRTTAAFNVLENTASPLVAGSAVAGITMAIEMGSASLAATGFYFEKERMQKFINKIRKTDPEEEKDQKVAEDKMGNNAKETFLDTGTALGFGAAIVIARKRFSDNERTFKDDIITGAKASTIIAGVSGFIGYLATGGVDNADKVGLEKPAEIFVNYATDWKVWAAVFGSLYVAGKAKGWAQAISDKIRKQ